MTERKQKIKTEKEAKKKGTTEKKIETNVSKAKLETVKSLVESIKNNSTIIIASIKNLPSKQFQEIRKKLRKEAEIKVAKKRVVWKAFETAENSLEKLKDYVQEDSALLFSKLDSFELAGLLVENKNPIKAKPGQIALEDIEIEAGVTDLLPGPAISELGALGIKVGVENGKIAVKEKKIIVKAGEKISGNAASIMAKLDMKPFTIGLEPIALYDLKNEKIYTDVKIDKEKTIQEIRVSAAKATGFAQKIVYYCKETISFLLAKANAEANSLEKLKPAEKPSEKEEEPKESEEEKPSKENQKDNTQSIEENKPTVEENK